MVMEFLRYLMESNFMVIGGKEEQYAQMKKTFKQMNGKLVIIVAKLK